MNILIIEDETPASTRLSKMLRQVQPGAHILDCLDSITAAQTWFAEHPMPDLVVMDIHLADGSAFDLLQRIPITAPIIFHRGSSDGGSGGARLYIEPSVSVPDIVSSGQSSP